MPRPAEEIERTPTRQIVVGALASGLLCWVLMALLWNGYLGKYWTWPYAAMTPDSMGTRSWVIGSWIYALSVVGGIFFFRLGRWPELLRRIGRRLQEQPQPTGTPPVPAAQPPLAPGQALRRGLVGTTAAGLSFCQPAHVSRLERSKTPFDLPTPAPQQG
ncbi:hypothetical protein [Streptomyces sp. NPDC006925]|uniref:hypothetical protein n=1 Tax=Streptomyces sp. NPDC006925 TaxID=3364768 RepID=UPI0036CFBBC4